MALNIPIGNSPTQAVTQSFAALSLQAKKTLSSTPDLSDDQLLSSSFFLELVRTYTEESILQQLSQKKIKKFLTGREFKN